MNSVSRALWRFLLFAGIIAGGAWLFGGQSAFLIALCVCFSLQLMSHFYQLRRLHDYLTVESALDDENLWAGLFARLHERDKQNLKQKQQLKQNLARFQRAAEIMPEGIMVLSHQGRIEWFNQRALQHLNLREEDKNHLLINVVRIPALHQFLQQRTQKEIKFSLQDNPNGLIHHLHISRYPFEKTSEILHITDISLSEEIQLNRNRFISNASHELRTPLTVLKGFLEHLLDDQLDSQQRQMFLQLMQQQAQRMENVVNDLMTLSRLTQQHHQEKQHTPLNLSALVERVFQDSQGLSQNRHQMSASIAPNIQISGNEHDLYSALSNLAFNAVHYTPEGGEISIVLQQDNGQISFKVKDTGIGIAPEHLPRLTERFYQVQKNGANKTGTGLGLAICKYVLMEHHATLHIDSELGKGSVFAVKWKKN